MDTVNIHYRIQFDTDKTEAFHFSLQQQSFDLIVEPPADLPKWTELEFKQCSHCPLDASQQSHCPLAVSIFDVVERLHSTSSIDKVEMDVTTAERRVIQKADLQHVIASMFDLIFPTSGCPKTEYMKPLARFHLPLASEEETVFRVTSMYLLAQYFLRTNAHGGRIELEGLGNIYDDMNILNKALASRLQYATQSDSVKNAIALLDMYSTLVPLLVDDQLGELRGFFQAYFPHIELDQVTTNYIAEAKNLTLELESIETEDKTQAEPAWMQAAKRESANKDASGLAEDEQAQDHELSAADKILQGSSLSLSLDPLSDN